MIFEEERSQVAQIMRRLYERGLTTTSGGNVSLINADGYIFITASQSDKSCIDACKVVVLNKNLEAFDRMEVLEFTSRICFNSFLLKTT